MALTLDKKLTKDEILTRYLNLVPFGNGSFGIQDAAQTYFGIDAKDLNVPQSAMLAGMVQSSSALNPYTNPEGVLERRNIVLDTMIANIPERAAEIRRPQGAPRWASSPNPNTSARGCIAAGDADSSATTRCSTSPTPGSAASRSQGRLPHPHHARPRVVQDRPMPASLDKITSPDLDGVATVMNVIKPGPGLARGPGDGLEPRTYGLDRQGQRDRPAAAVLDGRRRRRVGLQDLHRRRRDGERGLGTSADTRRSRPVQGSRAWASGGASGCPPATYCVENAGRYPASDVGDRCARPVTEHRVREADAGHRRRVRPSTWPCDWACARTLQPGTSGIRRPVDGGLCRRISNLGSFTLGPTWVNPLELSNVAATLASHGKWCPPSPIEGVFDREGKPVPITQEACEQVVEPGLADTLANALSKDDLGRWHGSGCRRFRGLEPAAVSAKTGTTESHMSSAFLGFTNTVAGDVYTYSDSPTPGQICSGPAPAVLATATSSAAPSRHEPGSPRCCRWQHDSADRTCRRRSALRARSRRTPRCPTWPGWLVSARCSDSRTPDSRSREATVESRAARRHRDEQFPVGLGDPGQHHHDLRQ